MAKLTIKKEPSPNRVEGNKFDKIIKENLEALVPFLLKKIIGLDENTEVENLPALKLQITIEKEPDCLRKIRRKGSQKWQILQIEFEAKDERKTDWRMDFYASLIHLLTGLEVEQHLIYMLDGEPKRFTGVVEWPNHLSRFKIHCISKFSSEELVNSEKPEEVVLGILANPEGRSGEEIVHLILERLAQLRGNSAELKKFIEQLKVFSMLRNLREETLKQVSQMSFTIPKEFIEADGLFIKGKQAGREEGMEEGIEKGIEKLSVVAIVNMLKEGFAIPRIAGILDLPNEKVLAVQQQLAQEEQIVELLKNTKLGIRRIAQRLHVSPFLVEVFKEKHAG